MTCEHCCGAERLFDLKSARKKMRKYLRKGPGKVTRALINLVTDTKPTQGDSLLDVGGGIGAIQWAFLRSGGGQCIDTDASSGFLEVAQAHALDQGFMEKCHFFHGDIVELAQDIPKVDYVTMDKVLCCYPDYESLLTATLKKCRKSMIISYPLGGLLSRALAWFPKLYMIITGNPFRSYIHAPREIEKFIIDNGFVLKKKITVFPWHVQQYVRS